MPHAVFAYVHHNRRVASIVTIRCKTDFALRTELLQTLGQNLAMQAAALGKLDLDSDWLLDGAKKVKTVIENAANELGEPVLIDEVHVQGNSL